VKSNKLEMTLKQTSSVLLPKFSKKVLNSVLTATNKRIWC